MWVRMRDKPDLKQFGSYRVRWRIGVNSAGDDEYEEWVAKFVKSWFYDSEDDPTHISDIDEVWIG